MATALTPQLSVEIVRQRLGLDASHSQRILLMIPEALKRTARKVALNPDLRDLMFTVRTTTTVAIASGKVALATLYSTYRILQEFFDYGQIWHTTSVHPLQRVNPTVGGVLASYLGTNTNFVYYYLEGGFIVLPGAETGSLEFALPTYPTMVSQLPASNEVEVIFLDTLVEMTQVIPAAYTNEDKGSAV